MQHGHLAEHVTDHRLDLDRPAGDAEPAHLVESHLDREIREVGMLGGGAGGRHPARASGQVAHTQADAAQVGCAAAPLPESGARAAGDVEDGRRIGQVAPPLLALEATEGVELD